MIKNKLNFIIKSILLSFIGVFISMVLTAQPSEVSLQIDGAIKYQTMDGFGVNISAAWYYNGGYKDVRMVEPAIDLLVDSLGATIFRAVIEDMDWEAVNDDNDPNNFNWTYYNSVFSNARFQGVWNNLRYLNHKGIANGLIISFMGTPPAALPLATPDPQKSWMGDTNHTINSAMEDEFVESIAALLYYARHTAKVQFTMVSPMNETDVIGRSISAEHPNGIIEGPNMPDAIQFTRVIKKLAKKLDAIGMNDIRFVVPDAAWDVLFSRIMDEMVRDSFLMSKVASWGVHQYGKDAKNYLDITRRPLNPNKSFWVTETAGIRNMMGQLDDDPTSIIFWDGFDCVYQHARRNGYGSEPPNDFLFSWGEEGKPLIEYMASTKSWKPRKQFYEYAQIYKFIKPGAVRIGVTENDSGLIVHAFSNPDGQLVIVGLNTSSSAITVNGTLTRAPAVSTFEVFRTNPSLNLMQDDTDMTVTSGAFSLPVEAGTTFTLVSFTSTRSNSISNLTGVGGHGQAESFGSKPEPSTWYAGDMHIHRNCGEGTSILPESEFTAMMEHNDLAVISVLADMGDGEVKDSKTDLPKVTGKDAIQSKPGRIVHWDAEWHFDPAGTTFEHKALGGHLVMLGLTEAYQIWDESPYKILEWGKKQNAIMGFCHMEYLTDSIQNKIDCCTPMDYPVEAALGTIDFLAEDVWLNDASVKAYYKLLNCGFRLGWAAGTDFPCNNSQPFGSLLTYVEVKDQPLTYQRWIEGIKNGRTVVSLNGHNEFLDLKVNEKYSPGDDIKFDDKGNVTIKVYWTTTKEIQGRIELLCNGEVVATQNGSAEPGKPLILETSRDFIRSGWICARRMDERGHQSHTAPVYVTIKNKPVRASEEDALYFVRWIDNILYNIAPGGMWSHFFTHDQDVVKKRYVKAKKMYIKIAKEAKSANKNKI